MAAGTSFSRVKGPAVGFFNSVFSSFSRVHGPAIEFYGKAYASYPRILSFADVFSTDTVVVRMTSFAQRGTTDIGDLAGKIIDMTSGFAFTLVGAKWSASRFGLYRTLEILTTDSAYNWPGSGIPSGTAFNIPVKSAVDMSGTIWIELTVSWNAPSTFSGHPTLGSGCINYWKLNDDAANSNVVDSAGSATGTLQLVGGGAAQNTNNHSTSGKINKALLMDSPSNVEIDLSAAESSPGDIFDLTKPFSMSFWTRVDSLATVINIGSTTTGPGFLVRQASSGSFYQFEFLLLTDFSNLLLVETDFMFAVSDWVHVVVTYDGTGVVGGMKIYVNGKDRVTNTSTSGTVTTIQNGSLFVTPQNPNGAMDEVGLWNRVLTPAEAFGLAKGLLTY